MAEAQAKTPTLVQNKPASGKELAAATPFEALRREIDRLFDGFSLWPFGRNVFEFAAPIAREAGTMIAPAIDASERPDSYEITVELPGIDEKDVQVDIADGILTIKGEKKSESEKKDKDCYVSERSYGSFERSFRVPNGVDAEKIAASFSKGVLSIKLPKTPQAQPVTQKIEVKAA